MQVRRKRKNIKYVEQRKDEKEVKKERMQTIIWKKERVKKDEYS